jgi:sphingolipid delta-4 desaturase
MFYDFITKPNLGADKRYVRTEQVRKQGIKMAEEMKRSREMA